MDWQQKAAACAALADFSVRIRDVGNWYVSHRVDVKDGCCLVGRYGNGATPQEAIEDHWKRITNLDANQYLVANTTTNRRAVIWNGFMWAEWIES